MRSLRLNNFEAGFEQRIDGALISLVAKKLDDRSRHLWADPRDVLQLLSACPSEPFQATEFLRQISRYSGTDLRNSQSIKKSAKLDAPPFLNCVDEFFSRAFGKSFEPKQVVCFETEDFG